MKKKILELALIIATGLCGAYVFIDIMGGLPV